MLEAVTKEITNEVMRKRLEFTRKVIEFARQHCHILHPHDFYGVYGFGTKSADLEKYKFLEIGSFVPVLAEKETRAIVSKMREQLKQKDSE